MNHRAYKKPIFRLAVRIHLDAMSQRSTNHSFQMPDHLWDECQSLAKRIQRAERRRFTAAAEKVRGDLRSLIQYLQQNLEAIREGLIVRSASQFATPYELYDDLLALRDEFGGLEWDNEAKTISVVTDSIVFDRINLGPFEIRLHWDRLSWPSSYEVVALEPNESSTNESVTHPHVQDSTLCEGEGRSAITRALQQCRLLDFFVLVRSVLSTYNLANAYVALERWSGTVCPECDDVVGDEDLSLCSGCERSICEDCSCSCEACSKTCCSGCLTSCSECDEGLCISCRVQCDDCEITICSSCAIEDRCKECHDKRETDSNKYAAGGADTSVQPVGLGETAVLS